jgi:hypothetical protein
MKAAKSPELDALFEVAEGDLWGAIPFLWNPAPASDLTKVTIAFREKPNDINPVLVLTSVGSAHITITNANTWAFTINSQILNLGPGKYNYYMRMWDSTPQPIHWIEGVALVRLNGSRTAA